MVVVEPSAPVVVVEVDPPLDCDGSGSSTHRPRRPRLRVMVAADGRALQRLRHLIEADAAVGIRIELGEHVVGLREIGAAGAERVLEFGLGDLAVAVGVDLREQSFSASRSRRRRTDEVELPCAVLSDDWLCAAISALIVSGEICEQLPGADRRGRCRCSCCCCRCRSRTDWSRPCEIPSSASTTTISSSSATGWRRARSRRHQGQTTLHNSNRCGMPRPMFWPSGQQAPCQREKLNEIRFRAHSAGPGNIGNSCRWRQKFPPTGSTSSLHCPAEGPC